MFLLDDPGGDEGTSFLPRKRQSQHVAIAVLTKAGTKQAVIVTVSLSKSHPQPQLRKNKTMANKKQSAPSEDPGSGPSDHPPQTPRVNPAFYRPQLVTPGSLLGQGLGVSVQGHRHDGLIGDVLRRAAVVPGIE